MPQNKVSQKFFAAFRIKMHGRRKKKKTALSSRGVEPCVDMLEERTDLTALSLFVYISIA